MEDDGLLIGKSANKLGHAVLVGVHRDVLASEDVAADVVAVSYVDDGYAGLLRADIVGELLAGDTW